MEDRGIRHQTSEVDRRWLERKKAQRRSTAASCMEGRLGKALGDRERRPEAATLARARSQTLFLIVDDDPDDFALLERALKKVDEFAPILWAQDGTEVIDVLARLRLQFDRICMVVDIHLPDRDGFELVQSLRERQLCQGVQIVFMTGNTNPALQVRALACGADMFILKPVRPSQFADIARQLTELSRSGRNNELADTPSPS